MEEPDLTKLEFEEPEPEKELAGEEVEEEEEISRSDPKWSDYVLRQFEDDEVYDGNPTTDGMRRVASLLIGKIIYSVPRVIQPPNLHNDYHAVVEHVIKIIDKEDNVVLEYGDCADFGRYNAPPPPKEGEKGIDYARWASATAATKAEGRALRKVLNLKRVLAAEEASDSVTNYLPDKITPGQINFIDMMCERNDINVMKLVNLSKKSQYSSIKDVPYGVAQQINKYLSQCQNGGSRKFPESIIGYDKNWRPADA